MVSGINAYNDYYNQYQNGYSTANLQGLNTTTYDPITFTSSTQQTQQTENTTADGEKDDGNIGFWSAAGHFAKGVWNFVTSPFKDENGDWSLKSTLKSAAIAALFVAGNVLTGGALTPILLATGAVAGTIGAGKAVYNIATAETDAEDAAAWESLGSSTATIAATAIGAKNYAKSTVGAAAREEALASGATEAEAQAAAETAASEYNGVSGTAKAMGKTFSDAKTNIGEGFTYTKGKLGSVYNSYKNGTLKQDAKAAYNEASETVKSTYNSVKDAYSEAKSSVKEWKEVWNDLSSEQKKEVLANLRTSVKNYAANTASNVKDGIMSGEYKDKALTFVSDPQNIAIQANVARQTVKPNFYDSLSSEEQKYYNSLPDAQKQKLQDYYYANV